MPQDSFDPHLRSSYDSFVAEKLIFEVNSCVALQAMKQHVEARADVYGHGARLGIEGVDDTQERAKCARGDARLALRGRVVLVKRSEKDRQQSHELVLALATTPNAQR